MRDLVTIRRLLGLLDRRDQALLILSLCIRLTLVALDLVGLAFVGVTVSLLSSTTVSPESLTGQLVDMAKSTNLPNLYAVFAFVAVLFFVVKGLLSIALNRWVLGLVATVETKKANEAFSRLGLASLDELNGWSKKELSLALLDGTDMAFGKLIMSLSVISSELILILSVSAFLLITDPLLFGFVGVYFALIGAVLHLLVARRTKSTALLMQQAGLNANDAIFSTWDNRKQLYTLGKHSFFEAKFNQARAQLATGSAVISSLSVLPRYITEIALMLGFALLVVQRSLLGENAVSAVTTAVFVAGSFRIVASMLPLQGAASLFKQVTVSSELVLTLDQALPELNSLTNKPRKARTSKPSLKFVECAFSYEGGTGPAIRKFSSSIDFGEFLLITGSSGAGKSTLADLIVGLREPTHGSIQIGEIAAREFVSSHKGSVSYVPQRCHIFNSSLAENIALKKNLTPIERGIVREKLAAVGLDELLESFPHGIDEPLGELARDLSGGQVQRIGLARALFSNPKILLLDEATSSLDNKSERLILKALEELKGRLTVIAIAHRGDFNQLATRRWVVSRGVVSEVVP